MPDDRIEKIPLVVGDEPGADDAETSYASYDEYVYGAHAIGTLSFHIVEVPGHAGTELALPVESSGLIDPAAVLAAANALPEPGLLPRMILVDRVHPDQQWVRLLLDAPNLTIEWSFWGEGQIILYRPALGPELPRALMEQWWQALRSSDGASAWAHDSIGDFEPFSPEAEFAPHDLRLLRAWSLLGGYLLGDTAIAERLIGAMAKPIRSCVLGTALHARLRTLPAERRGTAYESQIGIARFLCSDTVRAEAMASLQAQRESQDPQISERLGKILAFLDSEQPGP